MTNDEVVWTRCTECGEVRSRDVMAWDAECGTHGPFCATVRDGRHCTGDLQRISAPKKGSS